MADENTSPDDLIAEIFDTAAEFAPWDAEEFAVAARDELAAYRQDHEGADRSGREERPEQRRRAIVVPDRYAERGGQFIVFEVFVRHFIDPVVVTASIPELLAQDFGDQRIDRLAFQRFGEERGQIATVGALHEAEDDAAELTALAEELGRAVFGESFQPSDFWSLR